MRSLIIDSNILIYHLKGEEVVTRTLTKWFREESHLFVSAITRVEVLAAPALEEGEETKIQLLLDQFTLITVDAQIADIAARIRRMFHLKLGDSIIAATALLINADLVTRNVRDFRKIPLLEIVPL